MDIRNNKAILPSTIKRFALKTTASAILSLNAEMAMATSCPTYITSGSVFAGMVCDFDTGSTVTVGGGATVGGILMASYSPSPPSFITINAGGVVNNTSGVGIALSGNSVINGGILNNGIIRSENATTIRISSASTVSGGILNNGVISSNESTAIKIASASTISGGISNNGMIHGGGLDEGIALINQSLLEGDITNKGSIEASGSGNGIIIYNTSSISGGISNSGTINSVAHSGISVLSISTIQGNIFNSGTISGGIQGVSIHNGSIVGGSILNDGVIHGGENGLLIYSATTINGSISNNGTIRGDQEGLVIRSSATINGGISNSGTIQGETYAINIPADSYVGHVDILGQSARIIGAVEAPSTTVNISNGAVFTSEGSYHVNLFDIGSAALFHMAGAITANTVSNSGTLAVADPLQTIIGNYTQNTGGLFQTAVSTATDYGQLSVTGAVDLSQSAEIYVSVDKHAVLHEGDVLANVLNGNTLDMPANGFHVRDNNYIWTFIPSLNGFNTGLNLTATINPEAYTVCRGAYCQGAARAILGQIAAGNPLFTPYVTLSSADAFQEAARQATPELTNENMQVIQLITRTVVDVAPMWSSLHGKSSGDASYLFITQGSYQESGSLMNLRIKSNTNSSLILGAYGHGAYHVTTMNSSRELTLTGYAGIAGDVIQSQPEIRSAFVAGGANFSTFGVQFNEVVFRGGAGLTLTNPVKPLSIELNYDAQVGNNAYSNVGSATIKYKS